jgi:hypothetical protein
MGRLTFHRLTTYILIAFLLALLVSFDVPGCTHRDFPPLRDAEAYMLEVYRVEIPSEAGREHPDIESVIGNRRVKLLDRFAPMRLYVGDHATTEKKTNGQAVQIRAELRAVQNTLATLVLEIEPWEQASSNHSLPLDTWGTAMTDVDSDTRTLRLLVFRLNRPEA